MDRKDRRRNWRAPARRCCSCLSDAFHYCAEVRQVALENVNLAPRAFASATNVQMQGFQDLLILALAEPNRSGVPTSIAAPIGRSYRDYKSRSALIRGESRHILETRVEDSLLALGALITRSGAQHQWFVACPEIAREAKRVRLELQCHCRRVRRALARTGSVVGLPADRALAQQIRRGAPRRNRLCASLGDTEHFNLSRGSNERSALLSILSLPRRSKLDFRRDATLTAMIGTASAPLFFGGLETCNRNWPTLVKRRN